MGRQGGRLQAEVQPPQPQPDCIEVLPDYMASSSPQPGEKLSQELFPFPESRQGFWKGGGWQEAFRNTQVGSAPAGPLLWKRGSVWSLFPPSLPLALPPSPSFRPQDEGGLDVGWMMVKDYCFERKVSMKLETNPRWCKCKVNVRPKAEDDLSWQNMALVSQIA